MNKQVSVYYSKIANVFHKILILFHRMPYFFIVATIVSSSVSHFIVEHKSFKMFACKFFDKGSFNL